MDSAVVGRALSDAEPLPSSRKSFPAVATVHELSIVETLIGQVQEEVDHSGVVGRVTRLDVVVGRFSGVNSDAMRFAFQMLAPGTFLEGAELRIAEPPATSACQACGSRAEIDELAMQCPECGSDDVLIEGGRDLVLQSIELEEQT
jgi:hydrogenase nickel incorporation protein HypA/HybF